MILCKLSEYGLVESPVVPASIGWNWTNHPFLFSEEHRNVSNQSKVPRCFPWLNRFPGETEFTRNKVLMGDILLLDDFVCRFEGRRQLCDGTPQSAAHPQR